MTKKTKKGSVSIQHTQYSSCIKCLSHVSVLLNNLHRHMHTMFAMFFSRFNCISYIHLLPMMDIYVSVWIVLKSLLKFLCINKKSELDQWINTHTGTSKPYLNHSISLNLRNKDFPLGQLENCAHSFRGAAWPLLISLKKANILESKDFIFI